MKRMSWLERRKAFRSLSLLFLTIIAYIFFRLINLWVFDIIHIAKLFLIVIAVVYLHKSNLLKVVFWGERFDIWQLFIVLTVLLATMVLGFVAILCHSVYLNESFISVANVSFSGNINILERIFIVGFGEELIFRGYINDLLSNTLRTKLAVLIVSSLLFSFWHFEPGLIEEYTDILVVNLIFTFAFGALTSYVRLYCKNGTVFAVGLVHGSYMILAPIIAISL